MFRCAMGDEAADGAPVGDDEFAQALERASRGEGDTAKRESFLRIHSVWQATVGGDGIGDVDLREMAASRLLAYRLTWAATDVVDAPVNDQTASVATRAPSRCSTIDLAAASPAATSPAAMSPEGPHKQRQTVESEPWPTLWSRLIDMGWRQETRVSESGRKDHYYVPPYHREGSPRRLDSRVKVRRYVADGAAHASGTPTPVTSGRSTAVSQVLALPLPRQLPRGPKKSRQRQRAVSPPTPYLAPATTYDHDHCTTSSSGEVIRAAGDDSTDVDSSPADGAVSVKRRRLAADAQAPGRSAAGLEQSKWNRDGRSSSHYDLICDNQGLARMEPLADTSPAPASAQAQTSFYTQDKVGQPAIEASICMSQATRDKTIAAGATGRMIGQRQPQPTHLCEPATMLAASHAQRPTTAVDDAATACRVPTLLKPSHRRSRKPPPRWCEDPLAIAELGGSAAKLQQLELQRRHSN